MADALGRCNCRERRNAQAIGEFVYIADRKAWVFPSGNLREMDWRAKYGHDGKVEDRSGSPFEWLDCPFCGHELPPSNADPQADGEGPE